MYWSRIIHTTSDFSGVNQLMSQYCVCIGKIPDFFLFGQWPSEEMFPLSENYSRRGALGCERIPNGFHDQRDGGDNREKKERVFFSLL